MTRICAALQLLYWGSFLLVSGLQLPSSIIPTAFQLNKPHATPIGYDMQKTRAGTAKFLAVFATSFALLMPGGSLTAPALGSLVFPETACAVDWGGATVLGMPLSAAVEVAVGKEVAKVVTIPARGFQTKSGLKFFDLVEGTVGNTPRYGQLVSFFYTTYYKPTPESPLDFVDSSYVSGKRPFLHKHGNGRIVRGIDEGLHTMKVGGKRRLVVPKSIGYNEFGLGPLPEDGGRRRKLGALLDLLDKDKGELIFDVELVLVADDENDQGYYDDVAVSQEEVRELVLKSLQSSGDVDFIEKLRQTTPPNLFKK